MVENWLPVVGFVAYEVSDLGHVRRCVASHTSKKGRRLKGSPHAFGYTRFTLHHEKKQTTRLLHVMMAEAFIGPKPFPEAQVRHLDGDPGHNRLLNLEWGTPADNGADKTKHLSVAGCKNPASKLSEDDVKKIRGRYTPKSHTDGARALSKEYGVHHQTVSRIVRGERWTHV